MLAILHDVIKWGPSLILILYSRRTESRESHTQLKHRVQYLGVVALGPCVIEISKIQYKRDGDMTETGRKCQRGGAIALKLLKMEETGWQIIFVTAYPDSDYAMCSKYQRNIPWKEVTTLTFPRNMERPRRVEKVGTLDLFILQVPTSLCYRSWASPAMSLRPHRFKIRILANCNIVV